MVKIIFMGPRKSTGRALRIEVVVDVLLVRTPVEVEGEGSDDGAGDRGSLRC